MQQSQNINTTISQHVIFTRNKINKYCLMSDSITPPKWLIQETIYRLQQFALSSISWKLSELDTMHQESQTSQNGSLACASKLLCPNGMPIIRHQFLKTITLCLPHSVFSFL